MSERSPFRRDHASSGRLLGLATARTHLQRSGLLHGERQFGWPLMALRTQFEMGKVRHALSQRVVAGTMTVFPPFVPKPRPAPDEPESESTP